MTQEDLDPLKAKVLNAYGFENSFEGRDCLESGFDIGFKAALQLVLNKYPLTVLDLDNGKTYLDTVDKLLNTL